MLLEGLVMLYLLLLVSIPCAFTFNCSTSNVESWCQCTDLTGELLKLVCNDNDIPSRERLPDNTAELHISGNVFKNLTANFLNKEMGQLKVLNLTGNQIMYVNTSAFVHRDFRLLEVLILDDNELILSGSKLISGLNSLKTLSMKNAFYNGTYATHIGAALRNSRTENLESIILDNNDFSGGLLPSTFNFSLIGKESKGYIKSISLRNVSLELLFPGTFNETHLPNLASLNLSQNQLQTIDKEVITDLQQFINLTIDFTANPFICNCRLYDFAVWLNDSNFVQVKNREEYTCSKDSPKRNTGRKVLELDVANDLKGLCYDIMTDDSNEVLYPSYIALSIVFGIVAMLAMVILYLRRGEIYGFFYRMFNVAHESLSDKGGYTDMDNPYIPETPAVDV